MQWFVTGHIDQQQISVPVHKTPGMTHVCSTRLRLQELLLSDFDRRIALLGDASTSSWERLNINLTCAFCSTPRRLFHTQIVFLAKSPKSNRWALPRHGEQEGVHMLGFSPKTHRFDRPLSEVMRRVTCFPPSVGCVCRYMWSRGGRGARGLRRRSYTPHHAGELRSSILGSRSRQTRTGASCSYLATYRSFRGSP